MAAKPTNGHGLYYEFGGKKQRIPAFPGAGVSTGRKGIGENRTVSRGEFSVLNSPVSLFGKFST
jgi:hypothetical protein